MSAKRKKVTKQQKSHKKTAHQHPKHFLKVYWPYIPVIAVVVFSTVFGSVNPRSHVRTSPATLAYATEMGIQSLLSATNAQRASNDASALTVNSKLNASAQAKANDMVSRDYWAHNTPDGQEPWIFFDAAGYDYQKAGENLAYGFSTSDATIIGWMNSPSHRANLLDSSFTEVGFGFANGNNFVSTGQETIVVAHYAKPTTVAAAPTPTPAASSPASTTPKPAVQSESKAKAAPIATAPVAEPVQQAMPETVPASEDLKEEPIVEEVKPLSSDQYNQPVTSDSPVPDNAESKNITRLQWLTKGRAPWSAMAVTTFAFIVVAVWLIKHALLVKRFLLRGEYFVAHHPLLDLFVVMIAATAVYLSQSSGVVL